MEVYPDSFTIPQNPELEFEILPVTAENYYETAVFYAKVYTESNPLVLFFKVSHEEYLNEITLSVAKESVETNMGIICYCKTNKEIASAVFYKDMAQMKGTINYKDPKEMETKRIRFIPYMRNENLELYKKLTEMEPNACLMQRGFCTSEKYAGLGLATIMSKFSLFKHPIIKNATFIIAEDIHPAVAKVHMKSGYEILWEKKWEDFKDVEGCEHYAELNDFLEKSGRRKVDKLRLALFDRKKCVDENNK